MNRRGPTEPPLLSVVVPVHDEAEVLPALVERLRGVLDPLGPWELLAVDDGSADGSRAVLARLRGELTPPGRLRVLALARNFGHQVALTAGLEHARGEAVIVMDADLQDPPEVVPDLVDRWRQGADVVVAVRRRRAGESWFKRGSAWLFYRVFNALSPVAAPKDAGDFRLLSRRAVDEVNALPERNRYLRGLVAWTGLPHATVPYDRAPRAAGTTKYPLWRMIRLSTDALVSFSTVPLRLSMLLGLLVAGGGFAYAAWAVLAKLTWGTHTGWASLVVVIAVLGGAQLVCLGLLGEYVARIYDEVRGRPLYVVESVDP